MAKYRITAPDGNIYEITAPDDATEAQVMQYAQQNYGGENTVQADPKPDMSPRIKPQPVQQATTMDKVFKGMADPVEGAAQLMYNALPQGVQQAGDKFNNWLADHGVPVGRIPEGGLNEQIRQNETGYQNSRAAAGESGFDGMRLAGNVASPANLIVASKAMKAASLPGKVLAGGTAGAAQSAMMPVTEGGDYWGEKGQQVGTGAAVGGALPVVGRMIPKRTEAAKELLRSGVKVPFLQQFGQGAGRFEDKLVSVPLLGDAVRSSRVAAQGQFNRATWDQVLKPIGAKLPKAVTNGNQMAASAQRTISNAYDDLLPKLSFKTDQQFSAEVTRLRQMASSLPAEQKDQFERILKTELFDRMTPAGLMSGESLKRAESRLGAKMRTAMRSQNVWDGDLADALHETQSALRTTLERQNPQHAKALQAINKAQAMAYRPERATSMLGAKNGDFSPAQLLSAVKAKDVSKNSRAFSHGNALMQDWAQKADNTLSSQIPNSGTADRLLLGGGALGGLSMVPTWGQVLAGTATLPYLPMGGRALGRGIANTLDETANTLTKRAPYATLPINPAVYGLLYGGQDK